MKLRHFVFCIAPDSAHDRNLSALMDRAAALGLHCSRSVIGIGLASGTALDFVGIVPEAGCQLDPGLDRVNRNLEKLRADCT